MTDFPLTEITLRKYEPPYDLNKRELVKKICLSLGLLQPGDSRDVIVDILLVLLETNKTKRALTSEEIKKKVIESRKNFNCEEKGIAESNIRRQLKRLRDLLLIEKSENKYRIAEFQPLSKIFEEKVNNFLIPSITARIKEYLKAIES
ncbi:MAG: hypothetical protein QW041_00600 [Candidatus Pacearchaeota archaeon]